jgi:Flp pilus assembly protein TadB
MSLPESTRSDIRRAASVAALAAYIGVAAALYQTDTRFQATGKALSARHHAIESRLLSLSASLDNLERTGGRSSSSLASQIREKKDQTNEERRESARQVETWKEQSGAWSIQRWFVLAFATLAFLPVVLWGLQSWGIWARDKRLNRSTDV